MSFIRQHTFIQNYNSIKYVISNQFGLYKYHHLIYQPRIILPIITYRCNLRCKFCGVYGLEPGIDNKYKDMTFDMYKKILDIFKGSYMIGLGGGEPFLHEDIFNMIKLGRVNKMNVNINTNGTLLSDKIDQIIDSSPSNLNISLNASTPADYKKNINVNSKLYEKIIQNIQELVDKRNKKNEKIELCISYVCTKNNYKKMPEMHQLAYELGVDKVVFINLRPGSVEGYTADCCLYDDDEDVVDMIESMTESQYNIELRVPNLYEKQFIKRTLHCFQPFTWLSIRPNGDVYTCCTFITYAGNIQEPNIWNNDIFKKTRMSMTGRNLTTIPNICMTCPNYVGKRSWKLY